MISYVVCPAPFDAPDLPAPYCGSYELWVPAVDGEGLVVLNVWQEMGYAILTPFVRSFHGSTPDECLECFGCWLSALAGQRPCC